MARTHIICSVIALTGAMFWGICGSKLNEQGHFTADPNPLGIKRSPYGQVLARAIQMPIDADWHGVLEIHGGPASNDHHDCKGEDCDHHDHDSHDHNDCDHEGCKDHGLAAKEDDHDHHDCDHEGCNHSTTPETKLGLIDRMQRAVSQRTNPNPPTSGHKLYIRKQIEKKIRFAYELDPAYYANYAAYNFFLTQQVGLGKEGLTHEEAREEIFSLADRTIKYCSKKQDDPRPPLTAASAAYNKIEQMLLAGLDTYSPEQMRKELGVMDFFMHRHQETLQTWMENGNWDRLSQLRQAALLDRSRFTLKLREACEQAITLRETELNKTARID